MLQRRCERRPAAVMCGVGRTTQTGPEKDDRWPRTLASRCTTSRTQGLDGNCREGQRDAGIISPSWSIEVLTGRWEGLATGVVCMSSGDLKPSSFTALDNEAIVVSIANIPPVGSWSELGRQIVRGIVNGGISELAASRGAF